MFCWGNAAYGQVGIFSNVEFMASTQAASVFKLVGGGLQCGGISTYGGDCSNLVSTPNIQSLYSASTSSSGAFSALDSAGAAYAWGTSGNGGGLSLFGSTVYSYIDDVMSVIYEAGTGFVGKKFWGGLESWSTGSIGILTATQQDRLAYGDFIDVFGNQDAFCALKTDNTVFCWGNTASGGSGPGSVTGIVDIFTTDSAFAAIDAAGNGYVWGNACCGGDATGVTLTNIKTIYSTSLAFAALYNDGSVKTWGSSSYGGSSSSVALHNIAWIASCSSDFAAVRTNGSVVGWPTPAPAAMGYIVDIVASLSAFAAIDVDGIVYRWGDAASIAFNDAGTTSAILSSGTVTKLSANLYSFAAIYSATNQVVCWGYASNGGDCGTLSNSLYHITDVFGNSQYGRRYSVNTVTKSPLGDPTPKPTLSPYYKVPTGQPVKPTTNPTISQKPTKAPEGAGGFPTDAPVNPPTFIPSMSTAPVLSGVDSKNMTYYCRPKNYAFSAARQNGNECIDFVYFFNLIYSLASD
jgi:hypothetical protein